MSFSKEIRNLVSSKFNRLTVLKPIKKHDRTYLVCECECGNVKDIKMSHLKSGRIKSCGCLRTEELESRKGMVSKSLKPNNYSAKYRVFKSYEKHATDRGYSFDLDLETFVKITSKNCSYCGAEPNNSMNGKQSRSKYIYNGIDRVNNNLGYSVENCVPCCKTCNVAKSEMSREDFFKWISKVQKYSRVPFDVPSGPTVAFDVDDTLVLWNTPDGMESDEIKIDNNGIISYRVPNKYNINLLKKFYESGHVVIVWSASGVRWSKAVVKSLGLEKYVHGYMSKLSYFIDDISDASKVLGKHGYFDINGNKYGHQTNFNHKEHK